MTLLDQKHPSVRRLVEQVYHHVPRRLVAVEDFAPGDPHLITFVRAGTGEELCSIRTHADKPGRYDISADRCTVPECLIHGVVWSIKESLRRRR